MKVVAVVGIIERPNYVPEQSMGTRLHSHRELLVVSPVGDPPITVSREVRARKIKGTSVLMHALALIRWIRLLAARTHANEIRRRAIGTVALEGVAPDVEPPPVVIAAFNGHEVAARLVAGG